MCGATNRALLPPLAHTTLPASPDLPLWIPTPICVVPLPPAAFGPPPLSHNITQQHKEYLHCDPRAPQNSEAQKDKAREEGGGGGRRGGDRVGVKTKAPWLTPPPFPLPSLLAPLRPSHHSSPRTVVSVPRPRPKVHAKKANSSIVKPPHLSPFPALGPDLNLTYVPERGGQTREPASFRSV